MIYGREILDRKPTADYLVLALTPGIPFEWVVGVSKMGAVRKSALKRAVRDATPADIQKGRENASSITEDDALKMLMASAEHRGAVPLYVQLFLQATPRPDVEFAKLLGVSANKVGRWRKEHVFDPLTGARLS